MDIVYSLSLIIHQQYLLILILGVAFFAYLNKSRSDFKKRIAVLIIAGLLSAGLALVSKEVYGVERPCWTNGGMVDCPDGYGFPSAHSSAAIVFPLVSFGTSAFILFYFGAIFVFFSRLYLGVHTIDQVVAGMCIGIISYFLALYFVGRIKHYLKGVLVER